MSYRNYRQTHERDYRDRDRARDIACSRSRSRSHSRSPSRSPRFPYSTRSWSRSRSRSPRSLSPPFRRGINALSPRNPEESDRGRSRTKGERRVVGVSPDRVVRVENILEGSTAEEIANFLKDLVLEGLPTTGDSQVFKDIPLITPGFVFQPSEFPGAKEGVSRNTKRPFKGFYTSWRRGMLFLIARDRRILSSLMGKASAKPSWFGKALVIRRNTDTATARVRVFFNIPGNHASSSEYDSSLSRSPIPRRRASEVPGIGLYNNFPGNDQLEEHHQVIRLEPSEAFQDFKVLFSSRRERELCEYVQESGSVTGIQLKFWVKGNPEELAVVKTQLTELFANLTSFNSAK
jgi:hypothetical protein